ncbi:Calx-beta domain-containing protein [Cyanobacterium aponinum]|uniref:Na-Ca exchanger/integrin-beta4 n=1 Tax=Cyanobacterium aponinum (strain PCC 10605) TaxID=755178 RepID=K9Z4K8_CYAAP|nr:Calx-beta domain-containing protein [Cyanobacterium aponinum]AFZ54074.1 Na-Ca exchanger/integrin-beta4 [Cyanobacterium aponinum PCC 10605]
MALNLASNRTATSVDPSTGINHIVWADNEFIYHATYDENSGTWENANAIASLGNQTISNLNLVINDSLISEGQSQLPGLVVVWQEGQKNDSELYYTAAQYDEVQNLQWLDTPQPLTVDEVADLEPKVIVKDNEIIVVSTKVDINNVENLSIKEDTDVYFQQFTVDSSLFTSPQNVSVANAVYSPRLVNNGVINTGVVRNASYNPFTENEILAFNETILASEDSSFEGLLGSWSAQIYFSGSLLDSWKLIDSTPNDSFLRSIIKPFFEIFEIEGVLKSGVSPEWLGNQERSLFVETVANLKVKTPLELTAPWKVKNDAGGEEDSKSPISIGASIDSKYSFEPNSPFDLTQILDKITVSASLKFPVVSAAETAGFFTLDLTGSIGADWEVTGTPDPIGGDYFPDNFGAALGVLGVGALAQGTILLLTLDNSSNLSSAILADLAISLGETFGAYINGIAEGLDFSSTIGFPIISAGLSGEVKIPVIPIFSAGVDIGTTAAVNWGLGDTDTTFTLNFPIDFNVKLGPLGFGLDFYPGWSWTIFDNDNTSNAVTANLVLASESQAQVIGSLLYVNLGATFTELPNPDDFTVTVTDISGNEEIIEVFNVLQGNSDTSVILQLKNVIPPSANANYLTSDNPDTTENPIVLSFTNNEGLVDTNGNLIPNINNLSVENNTPDTFNFTFNPTTGNSQNYSNSLAIQTQSALENIEADLSQDNFLNLSLTSGGSVLATWVADVPPIKPIAGFVNGSVITLNFVDTLGNSGGNEPNLNQFTVTDEDNNSYTVENISNLGNSITLTLDRTVAQDTALTIDYQIASTTNNNESLYILNSTTNTKLWIDNFESLALTNITGTNNAPILLGIGAIVENINSNKITLVFDQNLSGNPINSQFEVINNGVTYDINPTVTINNNTVILTVEPPTGSNLIGIGDLVTVSYTGSNTQTQQPLTGSGGVVADFSNAPVITSDDTLTTVIKYGFGPSGDNLLSNITSIPGSTGLNLYPVTALDQEGNSVIVWANVDSTNIPVNLTPGEYYTQEQFENITDILATSDLYYSIYNPNSGEWTIAEAIETLAGTDSKITLGQGVDGNLMAVWLNTNNGETNIYWSTLTYNNGTPNWSTPQILSDNAKPDPLTELTITTLNGQPAVFWTETQPLSYYELTTSEQPLIYYRLAETEGIALVNEGILGAGGNGTYSGDDVTFNQQGALENTTTGKGDSNTSVWFKAGNNQISSATSGVIPLSGNSFSLEFWFKPTAVNENQSVNLIALENILNFSARVNSGDDSFFSLNINGETLQTRDGFQISPNDWSYIVLTYDETNGSIELYLNGESLQVYSTNTGENVDTLNLDIPDNTTITLADPNNSNGIYLDEVAFYNKALSYSDTPSNFNDIENLTGSDIAQILLNTNDIGNKYNSQYITPTPSGAKSYYVTYDSESSIWENPEQIEPEFEVIPTQLSSANKPEWDIVSATSANNNGNITPNGTPDIYLPLNLTNQTINTVINSIEVTAQTGSGTTLTWSIGTGAGNQLGVVQNNKLLNPLNPDGSFAYTVLNPTLDFDLFVDAGSIDPSTLSNFQYSINGGNPVNFSPADVTSEPTTVNSNQVMGIATVTEANDSSLALIDSGFITNTDNVAIGYVITNGDLNNDGNTDVVIGNRGYTDTEGNVLENGTIQILFGGGSVLSNSQTNPLTTTDLSGNPDGVLIKGIADGGDGNGDYSLSLATGDVNGDGFDDLVIGAPNVNNGQGAVYVIYGSASLAGKTIDVTNLGSQGYTITPNISGSVAFGYSVAVGNFNGGSSADIAIGTPGANNGNGEVYVAYDGNSNYSTVYSSQIEGELAGYSLGVSAYKGTSSPSTFTKNTSDDLIIGAIGYNGNVNNDWAGADDLPDGTNDLNSYPSSSSVQLGAVYVFRSNGTTSNTFSSTPYVSYTGANIANSNGTANNILAGSALASADLDGDGTQDLAIASEGANDNNGGVYVIKGGVSSNSNYQNLATVANLNIVGGIAKSETGAVITSAGDLNQDEYEDFLITAPQAGNGTGQSYVLFGPLDLSQIGKTFDLNVTANDSKTTFLLNGSLPYQLAGTAGRSIGDVNNDGVNDLMISAPNAGQIYSLYGHPWLADDGSIKLANITADNGFVIDGNSYSSFDIGGIPVSQQQLNTSSALATNNGVVYLAYKGQSNNNLFLTTSSNQGQTWSNFISLPGGMTTDKPPSIAFYNGVLYLAYKGVGNDQINITYSTNNGQTWSNQYQISGQSTPDTPTLVVYQGELLVLFTSNDSQSRLIYTHSNNPQSGNSWSSNQTILTSSGGSNQTSANAMSATVLNDNLYIAYEGGTKSSPSTNYYITWTDDTDLNSLSWNLHQEENIKATGAVGLTSDQNSLYLTYRDSNNNIYLGNSNNGNNWSEFSLIPSQDAIATPTPIISGGELIISYPDQNNAIDVISSDIPYLSAIEAGNINIILGDVNGDGFADILSGGEGGLVIVFGGSTQDLLDGASGSQDLIITLENDLIVDAVKLGDYNGDGLKDFGVLTENGDFYLILGNTNLATLTNLSLTEFAINNTVNVNTIGDYNGDGYDDFVAEKDGQIQLFLGNAEGSITNSSAQMSLENFTIGGLGDFNGDGYDDFGYGLPQANIIDDNNPIGNGQFTSYLGNSESQFNNPVTINPFEASIYSGALTSSQWGIYGSTDSNSVVNINSTISTQGVDLSPSIVAYNGYLYMVRNDNNNNDLWVQRSRDGYNWEGEVNLGSNFQTDKKTSLAVFNNTLYLGFRDVSERVMYASAVEDDSNVAGIRFNNPIQVSGNNQFQESVDGPSLIEFQDQLYVFFISTDGTREIIYSVSDTANSSSWSAKKNVFASSFNQSSDHRVSTTIFNDQLYVAFTGNGNNSLNVASSGNGTDWSRTVLSQFASSEGPSIVAGNDQLYLFHEGATSSGGNDFQVFYPTSTDGVNWTNAIALDDNVIDDAPYATFFNQSIYVAMAGLNDDSLNVYVSDPFYESNQTQQLGSQLQTIGDFNGDGIEDFAVLAEGYIADLGILDDLAYKNNRGALFIYYGKTTDITNTSLPDVVLAYSTVSDGDDLYQMTNFSAIGDTNGDGFDDIAISSPNTSLTSDKTEDGVVTVVFGGTSWGNQYSKDNPFDLRSLSNNQNSTNNSNDNGFTIKGLASSQAGVALDGGDDVNGDGFSDFVIGAPGNDDNLSFVLFGSDFTKKINQIGSIGDDIMIGTATGETFIGSQGEDQIYTNGGVDVVYSGNDDDFITVSDTYFRRIDGGTGVDILKFAGYNGQDWDLTKLSGRLRNLEILVIEDYGANTLTLNSLTVNQISDNNTITVVMDKDDTLNLSSDFAEDGFVNQYNQRFIRYTSNTSSATVLVNSFNDVNYSPIDFSLYNTGVDDSGVKKPNGTIEDIHYELTSFPSTSVGEIIITDGNTTISSFIQPNQRNSNNSLSTAPGDYTYKTYLTIPESVNPNGISINGKWATDDEGITIKVNGVAQNLSVNPNFNTGFVPFTLDEGFISGENAIEFTVNNAGTTNNQTYLQVQFENFFVANGNASIKFSAPTTNSPEVITIAEISESASVSAQLNQGISSDIFTADNVDDSQTRLFVSNPTANEASGEIEFTIQRTGNLNKYVQAHYISTDGRAKAGSDYNPVLGRLIFAPGETTKTVSVPLPLDDVYTGTREFGLLVTLEKESNTPLNDQFSIYVDPTDGQIRNWNHIILDRPLSVMNGDLEFRVTANEGKAETKIYFEGDSNFNSYYIFNLKTEKYEPFILNGDFGAELFDENGDGKNDGVILNLQDGSDYDLDGAENGIIHKRGFFADGDAPEIILDTAMYRFRSLNTDSSYLYVGEEERNSILTNYTNSFIEEGLAFYVSDTPEDGLIAFNRFRNTNQTGGYIYAGEEESQSIQANYPNFAFEGIAFYTYPQGSQMANDITRFQNSIGGAYIYTASPETQTVITNYADSFNLEGLAFEALV